MFPISTTYCPGIHFIKLITQVVHHPSLKYFNPQYFYSAQLKMLRHINPWQAKYDKIERKEKKISYSCAI